MEIIIYTDTGSGHIVKEIAKKLNCDCDCIYPVSKKKIEQYLKYDNIFMGVTRRTYYSSSLDNFCEENENIFSKCVPIIICECSRLDDDFQKTIRFISDVMEDFSPSENMIAVRLENEGSEAMNLIQSKLNINPIQFDDLSINVIGHPILLLSKSKVHVIIDLPLI
ncbi:MAG: hypothetical protein RBR05_01530 [Candidatus Methanomethylophilaceae archaeon]|nr:hypothetical protein [Candidatus Methanomethylophilaceae archaeon]MDY0224064.1 hypothetical protein [Candidatus Methanomethylophilaceae archaeon]